MSLLSGYCSRDTEDLLSDQEIPYEGETYTSSENEIRLEKQINRYIMIVAVLLVLLVLFIRVGSAPPPGNRENS